MERFRGFGVGERQGNVSERRYSKLVSILLAEIPERTTTESGKITSQTKGQQTGVWLVPEQILDHGICQKSRVELRDRASWKHLNELEFSVEEGVVH